VLLLCEAVTKLLRQQNFNKDRNWPPENVLYSALEVDLYWNFVTAALGTQLRNDTDVLKEVNMPFLKVLFLELFSS